MNRKTARHRVFALAALAVSALSGAFGCAEDPMPPFATTVTVTPASARLTALGATIQLSVEVLDQYGDMMTGVAVNWRTSDAQVAAVDAAALVMAVGNGAATITAAAGEASGEAAVTVEQVVAEVTVSPASDTLVERDTLRFSAEAADANGHVVEGVEFAWSSGDTLVAVVDASGLATGVAAGEAAVMATSSRVTGRADLTVAPPVPTTVAVTPDTLEFTALGQSEQLAAEVRDQIGRLMEDADVAWSSGDTAVATVDSAGLAAAVRNGAATITAAAGEVSGEAVVTVVQVVDTVIVTPTAATIELGDTLRLAARAFDANGHRASGVEFAWSSSDARVARVERAGLVTGVAKGAATISVAAGDAPRGHSEITVAHPDRAVLIALYEATDGPNWNHNTNWLTDEPLEAWHGVRTDGSGRVVLLLLGFNALTGPIPPELGSLTNLESLQLFSNSLTGPIPPELGDLAGLTILDLSNNRLTGPIPPELGDLAGLTVFSLGNNRLTGPIPPELGDLAGLTVFSLGNNRLTSPIPPELGDLAGLTILSLGNNRLTGPIPPELGSLTSLEALHLYSNSFTGPLPQRLLDVDRLNKLLIRDNPTLCVPGTSAFVMWLERIESHDAAGVDFCNAPDAAVLKSLYEAAGGADWTNSDGWLGDQAEEEWYGVATDSLGRVVALDLAGNGLAGQLPREVGDLARLTELRIDDNALSGRLPLPLAWLPLRVLHYANTDLCAPVEESFQEWLEDVASHEGTGIECAPLSERKALETLYEAAGGPDWTHNDNWTTDTPLGEWHGVRVDSEGRVNQLQLESNNLEGRIPPELGSLANLELLRLFDNDLTGPIPPELGDLDSLKWMYLLENGLSGRIPPELGSLSNLLAMSLANNGLTGPVPPELGSLSNLKWLYLFGNGLSGPVPPELGSLSELTVLYLNSNDLNGPIPPELGDLAKLKILALSDNRISGEIPATLGNLRSVESLLLDGNALTDSLPPELGDLATLEELALENNDLAGPVLPEFGAMSSLNQLSFTNNSDMAGPLPADLTALHELDILLADGTGLCAPGDRAFQDWLKGVYKHRVASCREEDPSMAYLTQAVQSRKFPVPLVAGEKALLRVFVTATRKTAEGIPPVRARFYRKGRQTHEVYIPGKSTPIPTEVDESSLSKSANAEIPGSVIRPGLEVVVEIDPDSTLDEDLLVTKRIPEEGRLAPEAENMPRFDLTMIPFVWDETHDSSIVDLVEAMAEDAEDHDTLHLTRTLAPVGGLRATAHEPVLSSSNDAFILLSQTKAIRAMEGGTGYWQGLMKWPVTGAAGTAYRPGRSSFSLPEAMVMAHELGHNMSLGHAPCGGPGGVDPSYPYEDGSVGSWGYDFSDGSLIRPATYDLMSYCNPRWISDYHFANALRFRLGDADKVESGQSKSLLLWGGIDADGVPYLEPAFVVEARPTLPDSSGEYRITGHAVGGSELFSFSFAMPETADGDGRSTFVFVLPVGPGWAEWPGRINLMGPGGSAALDGDSDLRMAILRDSATGRIRGILRGSAATMPGRAAEPAAVPADRGIEVLFSSGIPLPEAWRR